MQDTLVLGALAAAFVSTFVLDALLWHVVRVSLLCARLAIVIAAVYWVLYPDYRAELQECLRDVSACIEPVRIYMYTTRHVYGAARSPGPADP